MTKTVDRHERLEELFLKYSDLLYRIALVRLYSKEDAEDAVQETFIKYLSKPFSFILKAKKKRGLLKCLKTYAVIF